MDDESADEMRRELCRVGKVITVDLQISDADKALELAATMFNKKTHAGVKVHSWGLFSLKSAYENRDKFIQEEIQRHNERMQYLLDPNSLRDFCKE